MDFDKAYAHSLPDQPREQWELLRDHLAAVSIEAGEFADRFGAGEWGRLLGKWHDLGKASEAFQRYIGGPDGADAGEDPPQYGAFCGRVDHSTFGAQHAARMFEGKFACFGQLLAFCIAGHHAGLADANSSIDSMVGSTLDKRLKLIPPRVPNVVLPQDMNVKPELKLPFKPNPQEIGMQLALFTRMLFSCLVDADRLETEAFCDEPKSLARNSPKPSITSLSEQLDKHLAGKLRDAASTPINRIRAQILADCQQAAELSPGFFSLEVPTGGGKTLSSLAFALKHAARHGLGRVVYAIPFTSIVEQTADVFRKALRDLAEHGLLEHHSNIDPKQDTRQNKLAVENWDAPIVVTTNVQLFESLFASGTSPCRKLHRLARSVIILDEAQTLPVELLAPTLAALRCLVSDYGCTVVLCTATQPALDKHEDFGIGIDPSLIRPIIGPDRNLYANMKRVHVEHAGLLTDEELARRLAELPSVLCIVNTKRHAQELFGKVSSQTDKSECFHLSTNMCPQHRRDVLAVIRKRLVDRLRCRVISTQLIEAGVDVDFPCVYRAEAGFDSIAQAAGRCNREGELDCGKVFVFQSEVRPPAGLLRAAAEAAKSLSTIYPDPLAPDAIEAYFRQLYWIKNDQWDKHQVLPCFEFNPLFNRVPEFGFRTAAEAYKIIRDQQLSVLVPYDDKARKLRDQLMMGSPADYQVLREAQRYSVGVREGVLKALQANGVLIPHDSGLWLLGNEKAYSPIQGISLEAFGLDNELLSL